MKKKKIEVPHPKTEDITSHRTWGLNRKAHRQVEDRIATAQLAIDTLSRASRLISAMDAEDGVNSSWEPLGAIQGRARNHVKSMLMWAQHQSMAQQIETLLNEAIPGIEKELQGLCEMQDIPSAPF